MDVLGRVVERLKVVAGAPGHEVLVTGGGATAVTEAVLATFVAQDERLLVVSNGAGLRRAHRGIWRRRRAST